MFLRKLHIRTLLILLSVGGVILTSGLLLSALLIFQKGNIENSLFESNIIYARKLADITDRYFASAQNELSRSATQIKGLTDLTLLREEATRLRLQSGFFNAVIVVKDDAVVAATSPETLNLVGTKLHSEANQQAVATHKAFISSPFISEDGNDVVFISHPLFTSDDRYLGYIGGTIYLKKQSMLSDILSKHFYSSGSMVSIVSNNGNIIFSQEPALVGTYIGLSTELKKQLGTKEYGYFRTEINKQQFLTGYAGLHKTDWNIFISRSSEIVWYTLKRTIENTLWFLLGIIGLTILVMTVLAECIASPLGKLANMVLNGRVNTNQSIFEPVNTWYYEAECLKEAVQEYCQTMSIQLKKLSDEAMTDPLTGLCNRRGFNKLVDRLKHKTEQCIIAIDIDHFKKINDTYGHDAGDKVLIAIAVLMKKVCCKRSVIGRFGGDEFIIFLSQTTLPDAVKTAERLRKIISTNTFPVVGAITISAGVAALRDCNGNRNVLQRRADEALYEAKETGRNVVVVFGQSGFSSYHHLRKLTEILHLPLDKCKRPPEASSDRRVKSKK